MKKNRAQEAIFLDGNNADDEQQGHLHADRVIDARKDLTDSEDGPLPPQDSDTARPAKPAKLSKYRMSVKMLEENWESQNTIRSTTRARNMEIFDIVQRRAINEIARGNPDVETTITMPQIIEHFIADAMAGHYSKSSYARYRTALMSEMNIQLRVLGDAGEMSEYIDAIAMISQKTYRPNTIFDSNLAMEHTGPKKGRGKRDWQGGSQNHSPRAGRSRRKRRRNTALGPVNHDHRIKAR